MNKRKKRGQPKITRNNLEFQKNVPTFLKKVLEKNDTQQKLEDAYREARERPEMDDEAPLVVADEDLIQLYESQKSDGEKYKEDEEEKIEKHIERSKQFNAKKKKRIVAEQSKFSVSGQDVFVFQSRSGSTIKRKNTRGGRINLKRKSETDDNNPSKKPKVEKENINLNDSLLSFGLEEEEEDDEENIFTIPKT
eukprot:TRINITY_DN2410_c0_g1_i2.p1 TRINITY_DN2410_c0_g1~~TRINITY_DN2410_c0_g1_i2.p1  ORF type:complete len:194 (-),score=60.61 TRINITY_DN2410_c0_g1_i2:144-725(-)